MGSFRFLHAADLHLDSPFRGLSEIPKSVREVIRSSTFQSLERLVELAIRERVDFVVIAGDVYDLEDCSIRAQFRFHHAMNRLAESGIHVYIAHGNHDPLAGRRMPWDTPRGIHVFGANEVETIAVEGPRGQLLAYVHGISYATAAVTDNLAARFRVHDHTVANIGVLHTNVEGASDHGNYAPASRAQLIASGIDYWALGHIHQRAVLHESPYIVYSGNTQGRSIKETGEKGCYIADMVDSRVARLTFHATDMVRWLRTTVSVEDALTELDVKAAAERELEALRGRTDGRPAVVRLVVNGSTALHRELHRTSFLDELVAEWNEAESLHTEQDASYPFLWIESCKLETRSLLERTVLLEQESFIGDLLRIADELRSDERQLETFLEQLTGDLTRSRIGRHLRIGQALPSSGERSGGQEDVSELLMRAEDWLLDMLIERSERR